MHFTPALVLAFASLSVAAPSTVRPSSSFVARTLLARALGPVSTYDEISISGGVGGDAEAEALAKLPVGTDFAAVSKEDILFLQAVNGMCNDAEILAFNPALEKATGPEKEGLACGKTKNKVLKLTATILSLKARTAQGEDVSEKMGVEEKKLATNIATDKANAGKPCTKLEFATATNEDRKTTKDKKPVGPNGEGARRPGEPGTEPAKKAGEDGAKEPAKKAGGEKEAGAEKEAGEDAAKEPEKKAGDKGADKEAKKEAKKADKAEKEPKKEE
ncbi:hypothetical protein HYFRA_00010911 [Hymenoscyphus fraxineus]|uniref:Small secreted protein n=1 Tax=Hymenoscyphus fraxineus TaxID=746836 RepID=A0A9N9KTH5_9HELO|nr:hypothetical protein HYFRA_00010911 [Hymenoscyphus fraxineus]